MVGINKIIESTEIVKMVKQLVESHHNEIVDLNKHLSKVVRNYINFISHFTKYNNYYKMYSILI